MRKSLTAEPSAYPVDAMADQEFRRRHGDDDDRLDHLNHRERDLIEYLQRLSGYEQNRDQEADHRDHDWIVARQERDQHAGEDITVGERLGQPAFLAGNVDESSKARARSGCGDDQYRGGLDRHAHHLGHCRVGADEAHVEAGTAEMDEPARNEHADDGDDQPAVYAQPDIREALERPEL